ncbi:hypothetical protein K8R78_07040 [bacterium]|nr:hypothetical protein [bacterium]
MFDITEFIGESAITLLVFIVFLRYILRERLDENLTTQITLIGLVVAVGGIFMATYGNWVFRFPWWLRYPIPLLITLLLPPLYFKMNRDELWSYLLLGALTVPAVHFVFVFFFGWSGYLHFVTFPSLWEMIG